MSVGGLLARLSMSSRENRHVVSPALCARLTTLLGVLAPDSGPPANTANELIAQVSLALKANRASYIWLTLAVLTARLPQVDEVDTLRRLGDLSGARAVLAEAIERMPVKTLSHQVEVVTGEVLVDVNHLAQTTLMTGIQRVTHKLVGRWHRDHDLSFVCWTPDNLAIRRTTATETAQALGVFGPDLDEGGPDLDKSDLAEDTDPTPVLVVVPWRCQYALPEVALEVPRTKRLQALALYAGCATAVVGFDTVPLTSAETTDTNVPGYFMQELAAIRHMGRVATISKAAHTEYAGWRTMISSLGLPGPELRAISLPVEATEPSAEQLARTRDVYCVPTVPMVLCVGSHEPRKNHLAVLHAAELVWRRGIEFSLVFVGGNAWNSDRFHRRLVELQGVGRQVEAAVRVPDEDLWALYRLARCTLFPSLNEGFGLPVAESLASGTPVITSNYGSMLEIGAEGGALLVDPRNDHAIAAALRTLLTDDEVHARLVQEATSRPSRDWEDYASETWDFMVATNALPGS